MDVLCVGMYRACSTWQYEVAAHLVEAHRAGGRQGFVTGEEYGRRRDGATGWRVFKSHEGHRGFADVLDDGRAVAIYAYRDVRDVVFSLMHKRSLSFESLLSHGMIHQIGVNDRFWSGQPGLLVQRYEDLVADPTRGVEELAAHLGIALAPGEAAAVAAEYSFEKNRGRARDVRRRLRETGCDPDDPTFSLVYDDRTLLHGNHIRDGRVGGWRERATPRQRATLGRLAGDWLIERGYEADRAWACDRGRRTPIERARVGAAIARGEVACRLRGLSLRYPILSGAVKRGLRLRDAYTACPLTATATADPRRGPGAIPSFASPDGFVLPGHRLPPALLGSLVLSIGLGVLPSAWRGRGPAVKMTAVESRATPHAGMIPCPSPRRARSPGSSSTT